MRLVRDGIVFDSIDEDVIAVFKEAGYVEVEEAQVESPTPKKTTTKKTK